MVPIRLHFLEYNMNIGIRELILQLFRVHERKGLQWVGDY